MIERVLHDVRHGIRILTRSPGLSVTAALLIALVIGGNATIYAMLNGIVRRPAPGVQARDLVSFGLVGNPGAPFFLYEDYTEYAQQTRTLRSLAAFTFNRAVVATPNGSYLLNTAPVTANYFDTIGVRPAVGRTFTDAENREGAALVALIGDRVWTDHFARRPDVIGLPIVVNRQPATIVGVAPPRFAGIVMAESADVWVPLRSYRRVDAHNDVSMIGRLASAVSLSAARAEFQTLQARLTISSPDITRAAVLVTAYAASAGGVIAAFEREILAIFSIVTLLTLLVVCANVANLMLARAVARQRETAVRQSLGASRARIITLLAVEGLSIAAVACVAAFTIAWWAARLVPRVLPQGPASMPLDFTPDWRVGVYAVTLTLLGTMVFTLAPALRTWQHDPLPWLKGGAHTTIGGRSRISSGLVVLQLAFSVLLLTAAGLTYRSSTLINVDIGFDTRSLLIVGVGTAASTQSRDENVVLLDRIRERFAALPNVTAVSHSQSAPPRPWSRDTVRVPESTVSAFASINVVGPDYLRTLGLTPIRGRSLSAADQGRSDTVALINENLADTLWPGRSAVGQTFLMGARQRPVEVVGVVPNAHYSRFQADQPNAKPNHVLLTNQRGLTRDGGEEAGAPGTAAFLVRYTGPPDAIVAPVQQALGDVDPDVALAFRDTMDARLAEQGVGARMITRLLALFAGISLFIAAIGQYVVVAFNMRRRARDFGVRIALGASSGQVLGTVLREGALLTTAGLAAGFALSVGLATLLRGILFGVTPTDPPTYGGVFALLAGVSLVACYLPARRASRIDPVQALRQD